MSSRRSGLRTSTREDQQSPDDSDYAYEQHEKEPKGTPVYHGVTGKSLRRPLNSFRMLINVTAKHNIRATRIHCRMPLEELTSLTSKDRILLYLSDYQNMEDRYELPPDLIQQSIAYSTGVQRKHL